MTGKEHTVPFKDCDKTCPRECEIMNRILIREATIDHMYAQLLNECDYPDVQAFVKKLLEKRRNSVSKLENSLNKMYASFDPSGC